MWHLSELALLIRPSEVLSVSSWRQFPECWEHSACCRGGRNEKWGGWRAVSVLGPSFWEVTGSWDRGVDFLLGMEKGPGPAIWEEAAFCFKALCSYLASLLWPAWVPLRDSSYFLTRKKKNPQILGCRKLLFSKTVPPLLFFVFLLKAHSCWISRLTVRVTVTGGDLRHCLVSGVSLLGHLRRHFLLPQQGPVSSQPCQASADPVTWG